MAPEVDAIRACGVKPKSLIDNAPMGSQHIMNFVECIPLYRMKRIRNSQYQRSSSRPPFEIKRELCKTLLSIAENKGSREIFEINSLELCNLEL